MALPAPILETLADATSPAHTALLVIDVQNDFSGVDCQAMLPRLQQLIAAAREAGVYVVYVQNSVFPDGSSNSASETARRRRMGRGTQVTVDGTWGQQFVDAVAPRSGEPIVRKHRMNAFVGTDLDMLLRCHGIKTLICTGVATNGCVLNTALMAINLDYYVAVVDDCVASGDRELHSLALQLIRGTVHHTIDAAQLTATWQAGGLDSTAALAEYAR